MKPLVTDEDNKPRGRCLECNESVTNFYKGTLLCKDCYMRQDRKSPVVFSRCFGCGELIKIGYKKTWLCRSCYKNLRKYGDGVNEKNNCEGE